MSALEGKEDLLEEWKAKMIPTFLVSIRFLTKLGYDIKLFMK